MPPRSARPRPLAYATLLLLALGLMAYGVPRGTLVSAHVDDSWRTTEHTAFSVVLCEGPDGVPGTPDDRPRNTPAAGGIATLTYDATSDTWDIEAALTSIRAGTYRLTIGRFGGAERTVLAEFSATDDPANPADHVDVTARASGLAIAAVDECCVLEVKRNGPPWAQGPAALNSTWVLLADTTAPFVASLSAGVLEPIPEGGTDVLWTDDRHDLWRVLAGLW